MACYDLPLIAERFSQPLENRWLIGGNGPPHLILFAMNPDVAVGIADDAHKIVPARRHRKSRLAAPGGFSLHPEIDIALAVTRIPKRLSADRVHRGNRAALQAVRPRVVFAAKIGDKDFQGVTILPAAVLSESLKW